MGVREMLLARTMGQIAETDNDGRRKVMVFRAHPGCCPRCQALNGMEVGVGQASLVSHPHCQCFVVTEYK